MTELTKKQLIEEAKLKIAIEKCHPNSGMARVEGELFKIALASLEAEPVGDFYEYKPDDWYQRSAGDKAPKWTPHYAVFPAPVVPEEMDLLTCHLDGVTETYAEGWNACRAALLQGKGEPGKQVRELTMLVKQLVSQLKKPKPGCKLPDKVMDYLERSGLISVEDVLR